MHKLLALFVVTVFLSLSAFVVQAQSKKEENSNPGRGNNKSEEQQQQQKEDKSGQKEEKFEASVQASPEPNCDPSLIWKNHGQFVSCVAKLKQGGPFVSEAARSDVGKKNSGTPSASLVPSPIATSSATPTATPIATGSASPIATTSAEPALSSLPPEVTAIVITIQSLLGRLQNLLGF